MTKNQNKKFEKMLRTQQTRFEQMLEKQQQTQQTRFEQILDNQQKQFTKMMEASNSRSTSPVLGNDSRSTSPYEHDPSKLPPPSESFIKWMFYALFDGAKSTVVCIHPRFFVTFRHGPHLKFKRNETSFFIYPATDDPNDLKPHKVTVIDIDEECDFILLECEIDVVTHSPELVAPKQSECFYLTGFGDNRQGRQTLANTLGNVYSLRSHFFKDHQGTTMGPFFFVTIRSSPGDSQSGGGCWSARGLIGINLGIMITSVATGTDKYFKNYICPATAIKTMLEHKLIEEKRKEAEKELAKLADQGPKETPLPPYNVHDSKDSVAID